MLCVETYDYARKQTTDTSTRTKLKSDDKWQEVKTDAMKAHMALYINMGQIERPNLKHYGSHKKLLRLIFINTVSFHRFTSISRFLHFYDEETQDFGNDKLKKMRPVIRHLETKILHMFEPKQDLAL